MHSLGPTMNCLSSASWLLFLSGRASVQGLSTTLNIPLIRGSLRNYHLLKTPTDPSCSHNSILQNHRQPLGVILSHSQKTKAKTSEVVTKKDKPFAELTTAQKVKQAGKDVTYTGIVIAGIGVTCVMFYAIGRELLSRQSPSGVYSRAFKICKKNEEIIDAIGEPMKGYGELTRRGRRRHVRHWLYESNGIQHMRMKFYIEGPFNKGTVHLDVKKNEQGKYEFRYLFVELEKYPRKTIIVKDNR